MENPVALTAVQHGTPVHSVPYEVLEMILKLANASAEAMTLYAAMPDVPFVLILTWVCRRWRFVVRSSSGLCTVLPLQAREWLDMAIELLGTRSLSLHAFPPNLSATGLGTHVEILKVALGHSQRIRELVIWQNHALIEQEDENSDDGQEGQSGQELDVREEMRAPLTSFNPSALQRFIASRIDANATLFSGVVPLLLNFLHLVFCDIASNCPVFAAPLIVIILIECSCLSSQDEVSEFVKILTLVQTTVERLVVHYSDGHFFVHAGAGHLQPVMLSNLRYLEVVDVIYSVMNILACLNLQPTTELHITALLPEGAYVPSAYIEILQEILRWLKNHFSPAIAAGFCMGHVTIRFVEEDGTTSVELSEPFEEAPIPGLGAQDQPARFVLVTDCVLPVPAPAAAPIPAPVAPVEPTGPLMVGDGAAHFVGGLMPFQPHGANVPAGDAGLAPVIRGTPLVDTVRVVDVDHHMLEYSAEWRAIAQRCVGVEEIVVRGSSAFGLVSFLAQADGAGSFPMLRSLSVYGVSFSHQTPVVTTFAQRLAQSLEAREENSIVLSVRRCDVDEGVIEDLHGIAAIASVDWDGLAV